MPKESKHPLKVFLCHASGDKPQVRILYKRLLAEGVDAWLDQEKLLPGQNWRVEIPRAVKGADVVVICLSNKSITKEGYIQKEIKFALDSAEEKPEGAIFLIPARLEECIVPEQLSSWQWVDLYEDNGFLKLLRSLKLRADIVGAVIEQSLEIEEDGEIEHRLSQLYTEGLAAFYTEDWDRACQRFQSILSERPNHKSATEKLEEAERQRNLSKLYTQSSDAYKLENWQAAIKALEELSQNSVDYKDSAQLLRNARKQKQLKELYSEAKALHTAKKWQAVLRVFEQIAVVDSTFPDPDGLLPSTQKEMVELKRLAELNDLYGNAVREMETGQWYEARRSLEQVHKAQTGFLETEKLLRKVESEITKAEERNSRNNQINTLYEQAHGLIRSKNWRMVLDKLDEIQKLDDQFLDKDGIFEKAKIELAHEDQEVQKQNNLAAIYSEAVRLLKEGKYQEALGKWQEIIVIDSKYPDRQSVQRTARKKLAELANIHSSNWSNQRIINVGISMIVVIVFLILIAGVNNSFGVSLPKFFFTSTLTPTLTPIIPTSTQLLPTETRTSPAGALSSFCFPSNWRTVGDGQWTCNGSVIVAHSENGNGNLLSKNIYKDVYLEATVRSQNREASLAVRMQDADNGYRIVLTPDNTLWANKSNFGRGGLSISVVKNGTETYLDGYDSSVQPGEPVELAVYASGNLISVYLSGNKVLSVIDNTFTQGYIGFRVFGGSLSNSDIPCDSTFEAITVR